MSGAATRYRQAVVARVLQGPGTAAPDARRSAFDNQGVDAGARALVDKVARRAWTVTDGDVAGTKAAGVSEDDIFELTVCAALGQATRQLEAALSAVDEATQSGAAHRSDDGGRR